GAPQSPGNGMYTSDTGAAGTFAKVAIPTTSQSEIGRVALGIANGPEQDHNVVYAMVQDANKFNGGAPVLDVNEQPSGTVPFPEVFNGLYVSTDFGSSWKQLASADQLKDVTTNSAIAPACEAPIIAYCPGVQAWYNLWVSPDPTRATSAGIPTRLAFGLEEVWTNDPTVTPPTGLDGTTPARFDVVGRYYGGTSCTIVPLVNDTAPICPVASGGTVPKFTTHPDQHGSMWVPDGSGGVDLYAANDGGVYKQHVAAGDELDNDGWSKTAGGPSGHNNGMHTLQPYDAAMAKDGTAYMGLQDNGELKIDPNGDSYTIYGGDGFFTAVDPDNSNTAYEEYTGGDVSVTSDGGKTWTDIQPTGLTGAMFSTPFEMDRNDAKHLVIGGRTIHETTDGAGTTSGSWKQVYDLGTQKHPGDASAAAAAGDPNNQLSAVDTLSFPTPSNAPTGPKTPDFGYTSGDTTFPGLGDQTGSGVFLPGTYDDHPFTIKPSEGDASVTIDVTWADSTNDWDLYVYRLDNGTETEVGSSANGSTTEEKVTIPDPKAGDYVIRVVNFTATGSFDSKVAFAQRTTQGVDPGPSATYVGYCGYCDTVTQGTPFANGIATNVTAAKLGTSGAGDNWHIAAAKGLPTRYITSVRMDPSDPRTVYVTLAGYGRRWAFPGALGEDTSKIGTGHVFKSTDAGETFSDVSGDLPDTPANWSVLHNGHLVVGTDIGVFESCDSAGGAYSVLGRGLPTTPVTTMRFKPGDPDLLLTATYGRGAYTYRFAGDNGRCAAAAGAPGTTGTRGPTACAGARGFKSVKVSPKGRRGLRFAVVRRVKAKFTVDVFQQARGRKVIGQRRIAHFPKRAKSFTWKGAKGTDGLYFARVSVKAGGKTDARRPVFQRVGGRFRTRPAFYGNASCRILRLAKLSGPAFGGVKRTALGIALQTGQKADVVVTATQKAGKTTKRLERWTVKVRDTKTHRLTLPSRKAKAGDVQVTLVATAGTVKQTVKLTSKRLR
ncbi:MAG: hypothetical protein QOE86_2630, partial [Solirubrobacteraceae bacterium]|nr:hypothetical protein [Solirubrobacteraceae bacterium]